LRELKTVSVSFRVSPRFKRALQVAANSVNRTQTNFLETLVFNYCDTHGLDIGEAHSPEQTKNEET
jgi:predicted transcriptional regulator